MNVKLEEVPPPKTAPIDQIGETMGLVDGLRPERNQYGRFRCGNCSRWVQDGEWSVSVPDGVKSSDSAEDVKEMARLGAYNGNFTSWCLSCAPKKPRIERIKTGQVKWWQFWK